MKLIGNLLQQLKRYSETHEPLEQLEEALRRSYILVNSCQDRSYLYLLAMGCNIVYQFRKAQNEINRYLKIIPLITLVDNARVMVKIPSFNFFFVNVRIHKGLLCTKKKAHDQI
uniref:Putative tetratricopeptide-like helical domain-containing protein n=1 Tax=Helianthus annuus TaxID=4232 RepID=A0A251U6G2_HELAN